VLISDYHYVHTKSGGGLLNNTQSHCSIYTRVWVGHVLLVLIVYQSIAG